MALPYNPNARKDSRITFRLPKELRKSLERAAKRDESSMSDILVLILKSWFPLERRKTGAELFQEIDELINSVLPKQSTANPGMSDNKIPP